MLLIARYVIDSNSNKKTPPHELHPHTFPTHTHHSASSAHPKPTHTQQPAALKSAPPPSIYNSQDAPPPALMQTSTLPTANKPKPSHTTSIGHLLQRPYPAHPRPRPSYLSNPPTTITNPPEEYRILALTTSPEQLNTVRNSACQNLHTFAYLPTSLN
ncbi:uncharacterized protein K452DRAFT_306548 [Aplosporella prunicola CBS 121167]|uniref:Uncharacterized protein n=1 Tax=Aplosporella prunicola CBS 121167 TaxID=1176127 RepID=A0A6A6BKZ4_9PEZI|nr:uncharacterized protein K452DRAFT_306548 [Aplosporella prunicola CBS 121167]KAF2144779.1 hypothetical protein K452DRAFT_306548 [Aplosporella prunicola CBS 121167]